jgi:hypothetical protein
MRSYFLEVVAEGQWAVFRLSALGKPAAVGNTHGDGGIQRSLVGTSLTA